MIRTLAILVIIVIPSMAYSFELTQEHIQAAEKVRADGIKMGLDKMTSEQLKEMTRSLVKDPEEAKRVLTEEERKAFSCYGHKLLDLQFKADIKEFARYLHDEQYKQTINEQYEKECKVDEL